MIKIGIIGGTGYTGVELLRLLVQHPKAQLTSITSRGEAGTPVAELFANLRGHVDLEFSAPEDADLTACDLVFSATPTGVAMTYARRLMDAGVRLIDVAADFRLRDRRTWEQWYQMEHTAPELLSTAVYGLPELFREQIRGAQLVANPGCYPTAAALALLPLVESPGLVDTQCLICDAKSGVSGAGRGAKVGSLLAEAADSLKAYAVPGHRHLPEIEQTLAHAAASPCWLTFVPHLTPMIRGIHATAYARLSRPDDVQQRFRARYAAEPFIDVLPPGSHPETRSVRGANMCRIAVHRPRDGDTVVVLSVIDNLVKGAAGQAVQNMNIMFGFAEALGLDAPAVMP